MNISGKQPPAMPKVSGSIAASYRIDSPFGAFTPRVQVVYRGSEWARIFNDPGARQGAGLHGGQPQPRLRADQQRRICACRVTTTNVGNTAGINSRYTDPFGTFMTSNQYIPPLQVIGTIAYGIGVMARDRRWRAVPQDGLGAP